MASCLETFGEIDFFDARIRWTSKNFLWSFCAVRDIQTRLLLLTTWITFLVWRAEPEIITVGGRDRHLRGSQSQAFGRKYAQKLSPYAQIWRRGRHGQVAYKLLTTILWELIFITGKFVQYCLLSLCYALCFPACICCVTAYVSP